MHEFFKSNEFFNFELTRILGTAPSGGCEVAEFLDAVGEIKSGDPESWHSAFFKQAEKAEQLAVEARHRTQARNAFLRASNYFRASQYMLFDMKNAPDSRVLSLLQRSVDNFVKSIRLMDADVRLLDIPYQGHKLPGYLYLPTVSKRIPGKIPIVVVRRNCLGQGIVLRRDQTYQRPDWEVVMGAVLDHLFAFASQHPGLDLDTGRIVTSGLSLGGYYALRRAADPRVKTCAAIDAFYDMWDLVASRTPPGFVRLWDAGWIPDSVVDGLFRLMSRLNYQAFWEFSTSSWILGVSRPVDLLREMRTFTFRLPEGGEFLERVTCPVLASGATYSIYFDPKLAAGKIMRKLGHLPEEEKEVWVPKNPGEGELQAKVGAWPLVHERAFRFLDKHFGVERDVMEV